MKNRLAVVGLGLSLGLFACEDGDAGKSWSEFSRCMVGDGITQSSEVAARLRAIELTERQPPKLWDAKTQWPGRCEPYANSLYASLGSSTEHKLLKRSLMGQLNCKEKEGAPPECAFTPEGEILPAAQDLWDKAAAASLKTDASVQVPLPTYDVKLQSPNEWKALAGKDYVVADHFVTTTGVLRLLLKGASGPLLVCDAAGAKVSCTPASKDMPKVAAQSVKLLRDDDAIITGLTADGRKGFDAKSGAEVTFRGAIEASAREGVVIEQGEEGVGFLAIAMNKGKAKGTAAFEPHITDKSTPAVVGNTVTYVEPAREGAVWRFSQLKGRKLAEVAAFTGPYAGDLKACTSQGDAVGIWGRAQGERDAKPTEGDATAVSASFLKDGAWTKPVGATMPFDRSLTGSRCAAGELSVFWAGSDSGELQVGQLNCAAGGCETKASKWGGFDVKRWITAGPAGDSFVALFTTAFGETRLRSGAPDNFEAGKEMVLFDSHERGGPVFRDAQSFFTAQGAYLLVNDDGPILLSVSDTGLVSLAP